MSTISRRHLDSLTLSLADNCAANDIRFLFSFVLFLFVIVVLRLTSKQCSWHWAPTSQQVVHRSLTLSNARDEFLGCSWHVWVKRPPGDSFFLIPLRRVPLKPVGSGGWTVFPWFGLCFCKVSFWFTLKVLQDLKRVKRIGMPYRSTSQDCFSSVS